MEKKTLNKNYLNTRQLFIQMASNLSLSLLLLLLSTCINSNKKYRSSIEGYYYNGSTGEKITNTYLYLWEVQDISWGNICTTTRETNIQGRDRVNGNGYFCFRWEKLYQGTCCYYVIDANSNSPSIGRGGAALRGIVPSKKNQTLDYHRIVNGGLKFITNNISIGVDSLYLEIKHFGHSAPLNLYGRAEAEFKLKYGLYNNGDGWNVPRFGKEILADFYGMGDYSYSYYAVRKSDGKIFTGSGSPYAKAGEYIKIEI